MFMPTYKTPDVYVEEISLFPPSVAEVETAIPAFIGYTEFADEFTRDDLKNVAVKVTSLLEYEKLFGKGAPVAISEVVLDENNGVIGKTLSSKFYLYDSLRLFFKNGGGKCYIISIGSYADTVGKSAFLTGLSELRKKDEPTLILFPDAVILESTDLYDIQQQALLQCSELQDRFLVCDLLEKKSTDLTFGWQKGIDEFRNNVGINSLKYGAAYTPWINANLGISIHYRDLKGKVNRGGAVVGFDVLTNTPKIAELVGKLDNAVDDVDKIKGLVNSLRGSFVSIKNKYQSLVDAFKTSPDFTNFSNLLKYAYDLTDKIDELGGHATLKVKNEDLITNIKNLIMTTLRGTLLKLIALDEGAVSAGITGAANQYSAYNPMECTEWNSIFDSSSLNNPSPNSAVYTGSTDAIKMRAVEPQVSIIFSQINAALAQIVKTAYSYESTYEGSLYDSHVVYKNCIDKLSVSMTILPPSAAVAGIYAMVDRTRGVWKAPANVSLNGVTGVTKLIDSKDQEDLNVDVVAGKSINAIRPFTGKGILVWGARTLAGNDNEWRYVSVRRFYNMVEESVKKSTYWAVFEPNDANTWIKVKTMIENYLIQKWREGALAGAKPDQSFFVKIGLGITMTAQDILEGRMNVEIGMAVVRPAEFIVLKFSHKMQES
jgi:phage tail sheath protein FI